jgi:hypothetical protein
MSMARRLLAPAVVLALQGCDQNQFTLGLEGDPPPPEVTFTPLVVEPAALDFTHVVGRDPCPQTVGTVTLRNVGPARVTATVSVPSPLLILGQEQFVSQGSVRVESGQTLRFEVYFDCSTQTSFTELVDVSSDGRRAGTVQVTGRIVR